MSTLKTNAIQRTASGWLDYKSDNHSIKDHDAGDAFIICNHDAAVDIFYDGAKKLETTSTGINITGGIRVGGNNAANEMQDYEEGTWTPTLDNGNVTGYTAQVGTYTKIGNCVTAGFRVNANGGDTSLGSAHIAVGGLPFAAKSGFQGGGLTVGYNDNFHNGRFDGMIQDGGSDIKLYEENGTFLYWNEAGNPNNDFRGFVTYHTA